MNFLIYDLEKLNGRIDYDENFENKFIAKDILQLQFLSVVDYSWSCKVVRLVQVSARTRL